MLVHVQTLRHSSRQKLIFQLPETWDTSAYEINKKTLCSTMQMLQKRECSSILTHKNCSINISNQGANAFLITCVSRNGTLQALCTQQTKIAGNDSVIPVPLHPLVLYMQQQMIPLFKDCVQVSSLMQDTFGYLSYTSDLSSNTSRNVDATFTSNNATTVSKLTDMFNMHADKQRIFSAAYAARLLQLAAIFCASAQNEKNSLFHVGQAMISDMSPEMLTSLYDSVEPEKQHVTVLLKGDTPQQRIHRINLAVRIFPAQHEFVSKHLAQVVGLNASLPTTGVMVICGVRDNIAAGIYTNTDLTALQQHKLALDSYLRV